MIAGVGRVPPAVGRLMVAGGVGWPSLVGAGMAISAVMRGVGNVVRRGKPTAAAREPGEGASCVDAGATTVAVRGDERSSP